MPRSFWIDSRGCAKNQVDAEILSAVLEAAGWAATDAPEDADVLIVNSCGFIESAKRESIEALISLKEEFPGKRTVMAGCLSQRYTAELSSSRSEADGLLGNGDLSAAPAFLEAVLRGERPALRPARAAPPSGLCRARLLSPPGSAYLKVSEGCSNRCAYCAIPLIRGPLVSRENESVAEEAAALEARGIREIVLVGQDLGAFASDSGKKGAGSLPALLRAVLGATSRAWIRALYIHPAHFPDELLEIARDEPRFLPYFDIPFQHASAPVLERMGRGSNPDAMLTLVEGIRSALPDAVIRSTFLMGFPGETDADVQVLEAFLREARLDWAGFFAYSREEGTPAADFRDRVPKRTAAARVKHLQGIQETISAERMGRFSGRELDVLMEEIIRPAEDPEGPLSLGRAYLQAPEVDGLTVISGPCPPPGRMARCRIIGPAGLDLDAVCLQAEDR
jgi:ribosomal protein S12 methylthiotransferase